MADVSIEIRDLHGMRMGQAMTNRAGIFEIHTHTQSGQYILLVGREPGLVGQRITLGAASPDLKITLPVAEQIAGPRPTDYTISANRLETSEKVHKYLLRAQKEFTESDTSRALHDLDLALASDPRCASALTMRAFVQLYARNLTGALADAVRANTIDPDSAETYIAMSTAYNSLGQFQKGAESAAHALLLDVDSWQARLELAKSLYGQKQFVVALHELDLLDKDFPDVHMVRGDVLIQLERRADAAAEFTRFLEEAPKDPRAAKAREIVAGIEAGQ